MRQLALSMLAITLIFSLACGKKKTEPTPPEPAKTTVQKKAVKKKRRKLKHVKPSPKKRRRPARKPRHVPCDPNHPELPCTPDGPMKLEPAPKL